jgi:hypothetical protein
VHAGSRDAGGVPELPCVVASYRSGLRVEELRASRHPALEIESARVFSRGLIASHVDAPLNKMIGRGRLPANTAAKSDDALLAQECKEQIMNIGHAFRSVERRLTHFDDWRIIET